MKRESNWTTVHQISTLSWSLSTPTQNQTISIPTYSMNNWILLLPGQVSKGLVGKKVIKCFLSSLPLELLQWGEDQHKSASKIAACPWLCKVGWEF